MNHRNLEHGKTKLYNKIAFWTIILVLGTIVSLYTYKKTDEGNKITAVNVIEAVTPVAHADSTIEAKVEELKQKLVDEMVDCENKTGIPAIYDNNSGGTLSKRDAISYGFLQYKIPTLQEHYQKIYGKKLSDLEAARFALSDEIKPFVLRVWLEIPGSVNHWSCATPELKRRIEDIRFLTTE